MRILITICARGGSKGIPGKNVKSLNGEPLIHYSIKVAQEFKAKYQDSIIALSTDSEEIKNSCKELGVYNNYLRPEYLSGDTVGKIEAIKDILLWEENNKKIKFDYVLDLDVTSPLRNFQDLENALEIIRMNDSAMNLFSVSKASRSPYFNMVEQKDNGFYAQVKQPQELLFTRQSAPEVFDMNASFYFYRREFFELGYKNAITDKSLIYLIPHICFDIDHPIDFEIMSYLIENNRLDFTL